LRASVPELVASKSKEDKVRKTIYQLLVASLFVVALAPMAAFAQLEDPMEADVPFQFQAGRTVFPAGKYWIERVETGDPWTLAISSPDGKNRAIIGALPINSVGMVPSKSSLDFDKVGNNEILTEIWVAGTDQGYRLLEPRFKTESAAQNRHPHRLHHSVEAHPKPK
jgi:hypothetical protein